MKNSQKGIGLLQVLLGFAAVGGAGFLVMKSVDQSNKTITTNLAKDVMDDYTTQISMVLSTSQGCRNTFLNANARNSSALTTIKDQANFAIITNTMKFGTSNIMLENIKLSDPGVPSDDVNVVQTGAGTTYAMVSFKTKDKTFFSKRNYVNKIKMWVMTNNWQVTDCHSMADATDSAWTRENPSNNINYSLGNVGVGMMSPTQKLDVLGKVNATTTVGTRIGLGGTTATEYQIGVNADLPLIFRNSVGATANVVANKAQADQNFFLKPITTAGNSGVACSSSLEGAMRIRKIYLRNGSKGDYGPQALYRTQICSPFGGQWKWRTLKVLKRVNGTGAPCQPSRPSDPDSPTHCY